LLQLKNNSSNNNYIKLNTDALIHDFVGEYKIHSKILSIGTGLIGLTRFSEPGIGSTILGVGSFHNSRKNSSSN